MEVENIEGIDPKQALKLRKGLDSVVVKFDFFGDAHAIGTDFGNPQEILRWIESHTAEESMMAINPYTKHFSKGLKSM
jgi:hypothetical protein